MEKVLSSNLDAILSGNFFLRKEHARTSPRVWFRYTTNIHNRKNRKLIGRTSNTLTSRIKIIQSELENKFCENLFLNYKNLYEVQNNGVCELGFYKAKSSFERT